MFLKSTVRPWPSVRRAFVQHLQQHVEHVRMGFFHLVQQDHAIRLATHGFGQIAAFFIADIAGGAPIRRATLCFP